MTQLVFRYPKDGGLDTNFDLWWRRMRWLETQAEEWGCFIDCEWRRMPMKSRPDFAILIPGLCSPDGTTQAYLREWITELGFEIVPDVAAEVTA